MSLQPTPVWTDLADERTGSATDQEVYSFLDIQDGDTGCVVVILVLARVDSPYNQGMSVSHPFVGDEGTFSTFTAVAGGSPDAYILRAYAFNDATGAGDSITFTAGSGVNWYWMNSYRITEDPQSGLTSLGEELYSETNDDQDLALFGAADTLAVTVDGSYAINDEWTSTFVIYPTLALRMNETDPLVLTFDNFDPVEADWHTDQLVSNTGTSGGEDFSILSGFVYAAIEDPFDPGTLSMDIELDSAEGQALGVTGQFFLTMAYTEEEDVTPREVNPDESYYYNVRTVGFENLPFDLNSVTL